MHPNVKDLTGQRFERLVALRNIGRKGKLGNTFWELVCDCGNVVEVRGSSLCNGSTRSCGCLRNEKARNSGELKRTHGLSKTRTYRIWAGMIQRCSNPKEDSYKYYGAIGIKVCDRWKTFANFFEDMGQCPPDLSIDRINSKMGYEPGNCRWADIITQNRNTSKSKLYTHNGESRLLPEWAELYGIRNSVLSTRLHKGWSMERALTQPVATRIVRKFPAKKVDQTE